MPRGSLTIPLKVLPLTAQRNHRNQSRCCNTLNHHLISKLNPGSSILYVGSTLGEKAVINSFSYSISKHALIGMMRATCQDLAGTGIHTACINPGFTNTEMLREHIPQEIMPEIAKMSSFERLIEPQEIAECFYLQRKTP